MSLSTVGSVHCCVVSAGSCEPTLTIFISHRPGLRSGSSSATAPVVNSASAQPPMPNERSPRSMLRAPSLFQEIPGSVLGDDRLVVGAIGHPAAGKGDVAARLRVDRQEFRNLAIAGTVVDCDLSRIRLL